MNFKIVIDTCSDVNERILSDYNFGIIPILTDTNGEYPIDNEELGCQNFCNYLRNCTEIPTTSQPSVDTFIQFFKDHDKYYDDIIYITMSEHGSGTYNCAKCAKQIYDECSNNARVHIIDSNSTSLAITLLAVKLHDLIVSSKDVEGSISKINSLKLNIHSYYLVDNIDFLIKGGRVPLLKGRVASVFNIKPIIQIKNGKGVNSSSAMGFEKGLEKLASYYEKFGDENEDVYITHSDAKDKANILKDIILSKKNNSSVNITEMNKPMSVHSGPNSVGLFFLSK